MTLFYKRENKSTYFLKISQISDSSAILYKGVVGTFASPESIECDSPEMLDIKIDEVIEEHLSQGYEEMEISDSATLIIEYKIDGFGTKEDLQKRYDVQDRMEELLGKTGLGICDGGSIGSGTMEICCYVIDFDIAKTVIEKDLEGTKFSDYSRIYQED